MAERRLSLKELREEAKRKDLELAIAETTYAQTMITKMVTQEATFARDADDHKWAMVSSGGGLVDAKTDVALMRDPQEIRRKAYMMWRTNPHARGILRTFEKFIIGKEFGLDFADQTLGRWNDDKTKLVSAKESDDPEADTPRMIVELWEDFDKNNRFVNRMKEMVRRSFRDAGAFIRKFDLDGFILIRFIEPERIINPKNGITKGEVQDGDIGPEVKRLRRNVVGMETTIIDGIEYLKDDTETPVAYYVQKGTSDETERVPAKDVIHTKPLADENDLRGILLLESVMRHLANYTQWEEYRLVLNKMRTAVALVRRVDGTAAQARGIIEGRQSPVAQPRGREPITESGRRESMMAPGTIITAGPGVDWEYKNPNLAAADAEHDGRRILLSIAAGMGLPEMLVTGDWSNSNYSSSVESRTPAVREWEDWQQFFEPYILRIVSWVVEAAKEKLGLPKDVDEKVTIQWPQLIAKDAAKETQRHAVMKEAGILSPQTWCAREDLVYDDELENMRQAAEDGMLMVPDDGTGGESDEDEDGETTPPRNGGGAPTFPPKKKPAVPPKKPRTVAEMWEALEELGLSEDEDDDLDEDEEDLEEGAAGSGKTFPAGPTADARVAAARANLKFALANNPLAVANARRELKNAVEFAFKRARKGRLAAERGFADADRPAALAQAKAKIKPAGHECLWRTIRGNRVCIKGGHETAKHGPREKQIPANAEADRLAQGLPPVQVSPTNDEILLRRAADRRRQRLQIHGPKNAEEAKAKARRQLEREAARADRLEREKQEAAARRKLDAERLERHRREAEEAAKPQAVPPGYPADAEQQAFAAKVVVDVVEDGGGINKTYKLKFDDGTKAKWKPQDGENLMGAWTQKGMQWRREVNAYAVAKIVGLGAMRPVVAARTVNGRVGAALAWVDGDVAFALGRPARYDGELERQQVSMFDVMIGNGDRHHGNWIIDKGEMRMIDHGYSMPPDKARGIRTWPIQRDNLEAAIPAAVRDPWRGKKDVLVATMRAHEIDEKSIKLFEERYDAALSPDVVTWADMKAAMRKINMHMELNG